MAEVEWTKSALSDLDKLDKAVAQRIVRKVTWLSQNFDNMVPEALSGKFRGTYKQRVGDYRIVYSIESNTIVIQFIGHRREVYR